MICYMKEIGALAQDCEERNVIKTIERIQRNIAAALVSISKHSVALISCWGMMHINYDTTEKN